MLGSISRHNSKSRKGYPKSRNVYLNRGTVFENRGTVTENRGTGIENQGTVTENRGTVIENRGTVIKNRGTVFPNRGVVYKFVEWLFENFKWPVISHFSNKKAKLKILKTYRIEFCLTNFQSKCPNPVMKIYEEEAQMCILILLPYCFQQKSTSA